MERKNAAAAAEAESILVETCVKLLPQQHQETLLTRTEGSNTKRSSKAGNLRGGFAHLEHRRPDGWTSTPRGSGDEKKCSERDKTAGERLQNQRPHSLVRTGGEEDAHEIITNTGCSSGCDLRAGERLPKNAHSVTSIPSILNVIQKNILMHKLHTRSKRQVLSCYKTTEARACSRTTAKKYRRPRLLQQKRMKNACDKDDEILRLIEERRSMPKEEKQRLKDLSKNIKNASEKKKNEKTARHGKNP